MLVAAIVPTTTAPAAESVVSIAPRPAASVPTYTIEQFLGTTTLTGASWSPDSRRILVSSDQTGVFNAFAIPVDGGAPRTLLPSSGRMCMSMRFSADGRRLLVTSGDTQFAAFYDGDGRVVLAKRKLSGGGAWETKTTPLTDEELVARCVGYSDLVHAYAREAADRAAVERAEEDA